LDGEYSFFPSTPYPSIAFNRAERGAVDGVGYQLACAAPESCRSFDEFLFRASSHGVHVSDAKSSKLVKRPANIVRQ
jgi:hypothetical protein